MFLTLPETSTATILYQRAHRIRKVLNRADLKSQSEIDQAHMDVKQVAFDALVSKYTLSKSLTLAHPDADCYQNPGRSMPLIPQFCSQLFTVSNVHPRCIFDSIDHAPASLLYGIFYSFFESTPQVFPKIYHFSLGASGLPYLSATVAILVISPIYMGYWYFFVERPLAVKGLGPPEDRLKVGLVGSVIIPSGLFLYGK